MLKKVILVVSLFFASTNIFAADELVGVTTSEILGKQYPAFSTEKLKRYRPAVDAIEKLQDTKESLTVRVFFGTWCHDSKREVPRLIKVLKQVNNDNIALELFALDMDKQDPEDRAKSYGVKYTPTVIVEKAGKEVARFVEYPNSDWAEDLAALL